MSFQPGAMLNTLGFGSRPENVEVPFITSGAPSSSNFNFPQGKTWVDQVGNQVYTLTSFSSVGGVLSANWSSGGNAPASTTVQGIVYLATLAQTESGGAPSSAYVSSANDVATALAAVVVGAGVPATTAQQGYVYLATNAEAAAGLLTTNYAINPGNLAYALANGVLPGSFGATTIVGTANINASGSAVSTIATGGTGALALGNATGNTTLTGSFSTLTAAATFAIGTAAQTGTTTIVSSTAANSV